MYDLRLLLHLKVTNPVHALAHTKTNSLILIMISCAIYVSIKSIRITIVTLSPHSGRQGVESASVEYLEHCFRRFGVQGMSVNYRV